MFEYQKLDLRGSGFRLVRLQKGDGIVIECEIIHTTLDDNVIPYEAVLYTWGALERGENIYVTGSILPVTSNLWQILYDLRRPDSDRYLWVDAICINQDDDLERGHQVQQMKHIYQGADRGIFYLSPHTASTQVIMEFLALFQKQVAGRRWAADDKRWVTAWQEAHIRLRGKYDNLELRRREGLAYILLSPFFRRVWILQEVASVRRASIFCGTSSIPAHLFAIATRIEKAITDSHVSAVLDLMLGSLDGTINPTQGKSLASLLKQFGDSEASDEHDKIYALLGLCTKTRAKALIPDYTLPIPEMIEHTIIHIYGPHMIRSPPIRTVDELVKYLRKPVSEMLHELLGMSPLCSYYHRKALDTYIGCVEVPIEISDDLATTVLQQVIHQLPASRYEHLKLLEKWPITFLHKIISLAIKSPRSTDILDWIHKNKREVIIDAWDLLNFRRFKTETLRILIDPRRKEAVIRVSMKTLYVILLFVPDGDIKAFIPLLVGVDMPTTAALTHLRAAASQSAGSFRSRDAALLLRRAASGAKSVI